MEARRSEEWGFKESIRVGNSGEPQAMAWNASASLMNPKMPAEPRVDVRERHLRSFLKAFSWRITATLSTLLISYIITGSLEVATIIGGIEFFSKMGLYYIHERLWGRLSIGLEPRKPPPDYQI